MPLQKFNNLVYLTIVARWRSGYAEVCKTLETGSTPVRASIFIETLFASFCVIYL